MDKIVVGPKRQAQIRLEEHTLWFTNWLSIPVVVEADQDTQDVRVMVTDKD
jgi:hypothetical protein